MIKESEITDQKYYTAFEGDEIKLSCISGVQASFQTKDTDIVSIDADGTVHCLKPGTAVISAINESTDVIYEEEIDIRVFHNEPFRFDKDEITIGTEDQNYQLDILYGEDKAWSFVTLQSDAPSVVTVTEEGVLLPKSVGTATITAECIFGQSGVHTASCTVHIVDGTRYGNDEQLNYYILSEPEGEANGTVEVTSTRLGKLDDMNTNSIEKLTVPSNVTLNGNTYDVIGIGREAFTKEVQMEDVVYWVSEYVLPETLQYVDDYAFSPVYQTQGTNKTINFPASLERIGNGAFDSASLVCEVSFPENSKLTYIGKNAFYNNPDMISLDLSNCTKLRTIDDGAFEYCSGYEDNEWKVSLPEGLETIGAGAFYSNGELFQIQIPSTVKTIGAEAFKSTGLKGTVDLGKVETIGAYLFYNCRSLENVILPDELKAVPEGIFYGDVALSRVVTASKAEEAGGIENIAAGTVFLPESVEDIGEDAFAVCMTLENVDARGVKILGKHVFGTCSKLKTVRFSDALREVPDYAFGLCEQLESFSFYDTIERIGIEAFYECVALGKSDDGAIVLGSGLKEIGDRAFYTVEAGSIKKVTINSKKIEKIGEECFTSKPVFYIYKEVSDICKAGLESCASGFVYMDDSNPDQKNINTLHINAFSNKIYTGAETFQDIVIRDGNYMLREDIDYTVIYTNNIEIGTATVTINGIGNYCSSYSATYQIVPQWNVTVKNIPDQIFKNKEITPAVSVKLKNKTLVAGTDYQAEYLNNVEAGVATVIITGCGNYADAGMKEVTFNITECSINKASFEIGAVTYNGEAQKPVIKANYNGELEKGKDYRVVYSKNIKAGKGTATITGIGNYTGTVNKTFTINKIDISRLAVEDIFVEGQVEYDIAGTKAAVTVKSGELVLQEGTDYTLSYSNNKAIGKATVTIKGKGSCMGKATRTFDVVPRDIADASVQVQIAVAQKDKKGKAVKPQITVTQNKKKLREGAGKDYIVKYDEEATKNKGVVKVTLIGQNQYKGEIEADFVIVDQLINKAKIKGLQNFEYDGSAKEQTKQNITVKLGNDEVPADCYQLSYENNVNIGNALMTVKVIPESCNYEYGGSVTAKYKISAVKFNPTRNEQRITASLQSSELMYSGEVLYPNETVYDEKLGVVLTKDVDYRVTYKNNVRAGNKGQVTIKGINNYSGTITLSFKVKPKDLSTESKDFEVIVKNSAYTGKTIKPRIIIMDNGMLLKQNRDYALTIKKASQADDSKGIVKEKGKYIIIVEGKGNYTGRLADCYFYVY